jgi:hypothetical protein
MAQQTAVEWLEEELAANLKTIVLNNNHRLIEDIFAKAKAMEKEQIMEAWQTGFTCYEFDEMHEINRTEFSAERYYNNNYKQ